MENNMEEIKLDILIEKIQDDLDDSYKSYHSAMKLSMHTDSDMVNFCIEDAKTRLRHSDIVREKIAHIVRQSEGMQANAFRNSYIRTLESIDDLKIKLANFKI